MSDNCQETDLECFALHYVFGLKMEKERQMRNVQQNDRKAQYSIE